MLHQGNGQIILELLGYAQCSYSRTPAAVGRREAFVQVEETNIEIGFLGPGDTQYSVSISLVISA